MNGLRALTIREVVEAFEDAWEAGPPPEIGAFVEDRGTRFDPPLDAAESRLLLVDLVRRDLEYRWRRWHSAGGETPPSLDEYAGRHDALGPPNSWPVRLIASDFKSRIRWGDRPEAETYADRFTENRPQALLAILRRAATEVAEEDVGRVANRPAIPGYEIESEIGSGAFGVVYKARLAGLYSFVAIKMLHHYWRGDANAIARLQSEAEMISLLNHDNIVKVRNIIWLDGSPCMVLEYLTGGTLAKRLEEGPFEPDDAACIAHTLADAMVAAHKIGIIHRDLKPANILLDDLGRPKVGDFGLARLADSQHTATMAVLGTPSFMAPEQASGCSKDVTPAADVYALGAILYNMLSGRPPFTDGTREQVLAAVRDKSPKSLIDIRPTLRRSPARDLVTICERCLQKSPEARIKSAAALRDQLGLYLDGQPLTIQPVNFIERAHLWAKRKPSQAAAVALTSLALAVAIITLLVAANREQEHLLQISKSQTNQAKAKTEIESLTADLGSSKSEMEQTRAEKDAFPSDWRGFRWNPVRVWQSCSQSVQRSRWPMERLRTVCFIWPRLGGQLKKPETKTGQSLLDSRSLPGNPIVAS